MEVSVLIPCYEGYNDKLIEKIYKILSESSLDKFEVVLNTSSKYEGVCQNNIILTNNRPNLKCYSIKSKNKLDIVKFGVSKCMFSTTILVSLEDFSEDNLELFSSLVKSDFTSRFNVYFSSSGSLIGIRTYDLHNIFKVCDSFDFKDILNVCEYLSFSIRCLDSGDLVSFSYLCPQKRLLKRYYRKRRSTIFSTVLCEYLRDKNLGC